jgi:hypothetical protein
MLQRVPLSALQLASLPRHTSEIDHRPHPPRSPNFVLITEWSGLLVFWKRDRILLSVILPSQNEGQGNS